MKHSIPDHQISQIPLCAEDARKYLDDIYADATKNIERGDTFYIGVNNYHGTHKPYIIIAEKTIRSKDKTISNLPLL